MSSRAPSTPADRTATARSSSATAAGPRPVRTSAYPSDPRAWAARAARPAASARRTVAAQQPHGLGEVAPGGGHHAEGPAGDGGHLRVAATGPARVLGEPLRPGGVVVGVADRLEGEVERLRRHPLSTHADRSYRGGIRRRSRGHRHPDRHHERKDWHMDIMAHPTPRWTVLARTPGGSSTPRPAGDPGWDPLGEATDFTVGVVDTGVLLTWAGGTTHPWLTGHVAICPEDDEDRLTATGDGLLPTLGAADGHGTFVAGLVLREAPRARVRMHAAVDAGAVGADGLGDLEDRMVAAAIRSLALDPRVQVINLSFGGGVFRERSEPPTLLRDALAEVDLDRVAVVAAAGNEPSGARTWPAAFPGVIGVGAVDGSVLDDSGTPTLAPFSARGSWVAAYAEGVDVCGPFLDQSEFAGGALVPADGDAFTGWATWSGTSFAAATVSGRIAAHALEHGISGAQAAVRLLGSCEALPGEIGRLVR